MNESAKLFYGFRLIETNALTKQVQRRTHHKRRINKKWLKRYGYKLVRDDVSLIRYGDFILGSPKAIKKLVEMAEGGVQS